MAQKVHVPVGVTYAALTVLSALMVTLHVVPLALSQPVQLLKLFPPAVLGAVSVTAVLLL
ncbi:MAG: hypothetical protein EXR70_16090 [Deltaproteobacteria bacterium]|nr:hypothetical protein [Deltaproteobacteria bacterium]